MMETQQFEGTNQEREEANENISDILARQRMKEGARFEDCESPFSQSLKMKGGKNGKNKGNNQVGHRTEGMARQDADRIHT
jgi:hypothetical protein